MQIEKQRNNDGTCFVHYIGSAHFTSTNDLLNSVSSARIITHYSDKDDGKNLFACLPLCMRVCASVLASLRVCVCF